MSNRDAVFANIRRSLGVTSEEPRRNATVDDRLGRAPKGIVPARGQVPQEDRIALFTAMATKVLATVERLEDTSDIPAAVAAYLRNNNLPAGLRMGDDPILAGLPWSRTPIEVKQGPSDGTDVVGLSHAVAGVAETGTLVLTSGNDNPTTINFLPDAHLVVVKAEDVVGDYEATWERLRSRYGKGALPRTVNWVTGPSRSADIEQTIVVGAHGPRRLHILIVG